MTRRARRTRYRRSKLCRRRYFEQAVAHVERAFQIARAADRCYALTQSVYTTIATQVKGPNLIVAGRLVPQDAVRQMFIRAMRQTWPRVQISLDLEATASIGWSRYE